MLERSLGGGPQPSVPIWHLASRLARSAITMQHSKELVRATALTASSSLYQTRSIQSMRLNMLSRTRLVRASNELLQHENSVLGSPPHAAVIRCKQGQPTLTEFQ